MTVQPLPSNAIPTPDGRWVVSRGAQVAAIDEQAGAKGLRLTVTLPDVPADPAAAEQSALRMVLGIERAKAQALACGISEDEWEAAAVWCGRALLDAAADETLPDADRKAARAALAATVASMSASQAASQADRESDSTTHTGSPGA